MLALTFTHFLSAFAHIISDWGGGFLGIVHAGGLHILDSSWGGGFLG
jgi:hypothetical protein